MSEKSPESSTRRLSSAQRNRTSSVHVARIIPTPINDGVTIENPAAVLYSDSDSHNFDSGSSSSDDFDTATAEARNVVEDSESGHVQSRGGIHRSFRLRDIEGTRPHFGVRVIPNYFTTVHLREYEGKRVNF